MTVLVRDMWRFPPQLVLLLLLAIAKMKQSRAAAATSSVRLQYMQTPLCSTCNRLSKAKAKVILWILADL